MNEVVWTEKSRDWSHDIDLTDCIDWRSLEASGWIDPMQASDLPTYARQIRQSSTDTILGQRHIGPSACLANEPIPTQGDPNITISTEHQAYHEQPQLEVSNDTSIGRAVKVADRAHCRKLPRGASDPSILCQSDESLQHDALNVISSNSADTSENARELVCPYPDCRYKRPFKRRYGLERHIKSQHGGPKKQFLCPYPGCFDVHSRTAVTRSDELTAHIRNGHRCNRAPRLECPESNCSAPPMGLDLLHVHLYGSHYNERKLAPNSRAILNAGSSEYSPCPVSSCRISPRLQELILHLMRHDQHELEKSENDLLRCNYSLVWSTSSLLPNGVQRTRTCSLAARFVQRILILCPLCAYAFEDHAAFEDHFNTSHAVRRAEQAHFHAWRQHTCDHFGIAGDDLKWHKPWKEWNLKLWREQVEMIRCPQCSYAGRSDALQHHLEMLVDPEEIRFARRDVLRLYPGFFTHPVFDDIK